MAMTRHEAWGKAREPDGENAGTQHKVYGKNESNLIFPPSNCHAIKAFRLDEHSRNFTELTWPMFFKKISLNNFGSFDRFEMTFSAGVNIIEGNNGVGKTQLIGALFAALIGKAAIRINTDGTGSSAVRVLIDEGGILETLTLNISSDHQGNPRIDRTSSTENDTALVSPSARLLSMLSNPDGPHLVLGRDTDFGTLPSFNMNTMGQLLPEKLRRSQLWSHIRERGTLYDANSSRGLHCFSKLLGEFFLRKSTNQSLPLIVDEFFELLPDDLPDFSMSLLENLAETTQVIVLTNVRRSLGAHNINRLDRASERVASLAYYNYLLEHQQPRLKPSLKTRWVKGQKFAKQESRSCELKEVKGANPLGSIKSVVDQYVVAFLNAGTPQEGAIFWGIRDEDLAITGVTLSDQECDALRRVVTEKLHQITPPIPPTKYRIELHQVSDGTKLIPNLYVVEIRVPSIRKTLLFATGSQEIYVKTDSGKKKLSALEIQYELLDRHGIDPTS